MSFKDKLKTIKTKNQPVKTAPKIDEPISPVNDDLNLPSMEELANSVPHYTDADENDFDDEDLDFDDEPAPKKSKLSKKRATKKPKRSKSTKKANSSSDGKSKLVLLGLLLVLGLCALGFFLKDTLLGGDDTTATPQVTQPKPQAPKDKKVAPTPPGEVTAQSSENTANNDVTGNNSVASQPTENVDIDLLEEEITAEIPSTEVEAAEEIDSLTDESQRLDTQAEEISQLIDDKQELITLQEKKIAMLEAQIAKAEAKATGATSTPDDK